MIRSLCVKQRAIVRISFAVLVMAHSVGDSRLSRRIECRLLDTGTADNRFFYVYVTRCCILCERAGLKNFLRSCRKNIRDLPLKLEY